MYSDCLLLLISLCHCYIILFLHRFILRLFFLWKVPLMSLFLFLFFSFLHFFFQCTYTFQQWEKGHLTAFSTGNSDHARNLRRIAQVYFGVKSRTESGLMDKKSLIFC